MRVRFKKMQALGNDFVVLDGVRQALDIGPRQAARIADRRLGVGCDQILLAEAAETADFRLRIFNADGSEVGQCGNGARCLARFLREEGLTAKRDIVVETTSGKLGLHVNGVGTVAVDMGIPTFEPRRIPFASDVMLPSYELGVDDRNVTVSVVGIGNPHAVCIVDDVEAAPVAEFGPKIETHPWFPERTNVGFMQILDRTTIKLRVHERGAGETRACGSGACAAVVVGNRIGVLEGSVRVMLPGGVLQIAWGGVGESVIMTGPAENVFEGSLDLDEL